MSVSNVKIYTLKNRQLTLFFFTMVNVVSWPLLETQQTFTNVRNDSVKEHVKVPAYLTYIQSTSCKMPGWMKHKLESRLLGEISITSDMQVTPPLWQEVKKN